MSGPGTDAIAVVVERNPAEVPRAEMTALARRILDGAGFDPGFDLAPERLETLRAAPRVAARDLPTRGIEGAGLRSYTGLPVVDRGY
ncbi:hypothetical protein ACFRDV_23720 [Streptomyces fagopyri]|uniref:hypothetical protein n=1 Tax=Streptomyces fagopyri TaxID=2662397 RepID=UPI0036C6AEFC